MEMRNEHPPEALLENIITTIQDRFWGFEALALASIIERSKHTPALEKLPAIPEIAKTPEARIALARFWLRCWQGHGFWLSAMPGSWENRSSSDGISVKTRRPKSTFKAIDALLPVFGLRQCRNQGP